MPPMFPQNLIVLCLLAGCQRAVEAVWSTPTDPTIQRAGGDSAADTGAQPRDTGVGDTASPLLDVDGDGFLAPEDCDDGDPLWYPGDGVEPAWEKDRCPSSGGMARFGDVADWTLYTGGASTLALSEWAEGCVDGGLTLTYTLEASADDEVPQAWVVIRQEIPHGRGDLVGDDYILLPLAGEPGTEPMTLEVKLQDADGCMATVTYADFTDLPATRTLILPIDSFLLAGERDCAQGYLEAGEITAFEIGISDPDAAVGRSVSGVFHLDDSGATALDDQLHPAHFECAGRDDTALDRIFEALAARRDDLGLLLTWEDEANYNIYAQALALMVFSLEVERSGSPDARVAAEGLAAVLVDLQQPDGTWYDSYRREGSALLVDTATVWEGNVAWTAMALQLAGEILGGDVALEVSTTTAAAAQWLLARQVAEGNGSVTTGAEGNVSSALALLAMGHEEEAHAIYDFVMRDESAGGLWDSDEGRIRMAVGDAGLAIDVMGNWGAWLMRAFGDHELALKSLDRAGWLFVVESWTDSPKVYGLGDIAGPYQPTVEFSAQYAAVGGPGAALVMEQMLALDTDGDGLFPGAPADFSGGSGWNTAMEGVPSSAWMYIALHGGLVGRWTEGS